MSHELQLRMTFEATMLRLRRGALLAHWVPGTGLLIRQGDRSIMRVTATPSHPSSEPMPEIGPCEFRRMVVALDTDLGCGMHAIDPTLPTEVVVTTNTATRHRLDGLVIAHVNDEIGMADCAVAIDEATARAVVDAHRSDLDGVSTPPLDIHFDTDDELGVTLIHRAFELDQPPQRQRVTEVLADLIPHLAAEEAIRTVDQLRR